MDRYPAYFALLFLLFAGCSTVSPPLQTVYRPTTEIAPFLPESAERSAAEEPIETSANVSQANAHVVDVLAAQSPDGTWEFHVTVAHAEKGWSDYTDGWNVELPDGTVLLADPSDKFTRRMFHPHVRNRRLRRSQSGLVVPSDVDHVIVRAHDSKHGFGGKAIEVWLNEESGDGFEVRK